MGLPEFDGYASELRHGIYRGDLKTGKPPRYHRRSALTSRATHR
ncbi:hypothetical protein OG607_29735 [Streptomyces sp. NBC_01537]